MMAADPDKSLLRQFSRRGVRQSRSAILPSIRFPRIFRRQLKFDVPVCGKHLPAADFPVRGYILQSGEPGSGYQAGGSEQLPRFPGHQGPPLLHNCNRITEFVNFLPAVGNQQRFSRKLPENLHQLPVHLIPEKRIQRGERLVKEDNPRSARQHPGQGCPLLLAAGKLRGPELFQPLQLKPLDLFPDNLFP